MGVSTSSVVICAYTEDRWDRILMAVESLRNQTLPATEIILVVDHNPTLYARLSAEFPAVTVLENKWQRGLSGARNTGIGAASGELVAFLDDDAAAYPDWLKFLTAAYDDPSVIGVGGLTVADWETARPAWMPSEFDWVIGCNYTGMPPSGAQVRNLLGGNMSFRREVFDLVEGFQTGIGREAGKRPEGCEETVFCIMVGQRSPQSKMVMEHRAVVSHFVPAKRARFSYFVSRCHAEGISKARVARTVGSVDGLAAERAYTTRTLPLGVARGLADLCRGHLGGLGRAAAIVSGLTVTAFGYFVARLGGAIQSKSASSLAERPVPVRS
jgi:hypothetical protein